MLSSFPFVLWSDVIVRIPFPSPNDQLRSGILTSVLFADSILSRLSLTRYAMRVITSPLRLNYHTDISRPPVKLLAIYENVTNNPEFIIVEKVI
ncbi:hypothetical protein CEXT_782741 [Caerostris extrusa]|uniref:Uncharacterized protein n=1 Tax=Caerostris extrusa TaxID=172846 RepID=A0AAV4VMM5_CAEEX|nr:hypothetical protein CEXT_782741 [Caerostris extrusa]